MSHVFIILEVESFNFKILTAELSTSQSLKVMSLAINSLFVKHFIALYNYLIVPWVSCNIDQYMIHLCNFKMVMMLRYQVMV